MKRGLFERIGGARRERRKGTSGGHSSRVASGLVLTWASDRHGLQPVCSGLSRRAAGRRACEEMLRRANAPRVMNDDRNSVKPADAPSSLPLSSSLVPPCLSPEQFQALGPAALRPCGPFVIYSPRTISVKKNICAALSIAEGPLLYSFFSCGAAMRRAVEAEKARAPIGVTVEARAARRGAVKPRRARGRDMVVGVLLGMSGVVTSLHSTLREAPPTALQREGRPLQAEGGRRNYGTRGVWLPLQLPYVTTTTASQEPAKAKRQPGTGLPAGWCSRAAANQTRSD